MTEGEVRTYEIVLTDGTRQRITIPAAWKVSFGAIVPGSAKSSGQAYGGAGWGLRVWEATDKQRAVYSGVVEFRDISIPTEVRAVRKYGSGDDEWFVDNGTWVGKKGDAVEHGWRDPATLMPAPDEEPVAENDSWVPRRFATKEF